MYQLIVITEKKTSVYHTANVNRASKTAKMIK